MTEPGGVTGRGPGAEARDEPADEPAGPRGTPFQRLRAALLGALVAVVARLPGRLVDAATDAIGELWYRLAPGRAAVARGNLAHVAARLAAEGRGSPRARAAATDPAALERLVAEAFRYAVRFYVETARWDAVVRDARRRLVLETPETLAAAFASPAPMVIATMHFGSLTGAAAVLADRLPIPVTAPMETLPDPELQRLVRRLRRGTADRIVGIREARRELRAALARGEAVGIIADRDIAGGGIEVPLFGLPAALPIGPAFLAVDAGVPLHVAAVRRAPDGYRGGLVTLPRPPAGLPRRARVEALMAAEAAAFETFVAAAPGQWWAVCYPIWDAVAPMPRRPLATNAAGGAESRT